MLTLLAAEIEL